MSEELQSPPVIDIEGLLQPIAGENPSGEYLRYSGIYDAISEARRADLDVNQGEWQTELKVADYREVINLAVPAITQQSKDLQIAAWLAEALVKTHGFNGLRDGLKILFELQNIFWDTLHPEIDEGDMEGRANAISWLQSQAGLAVRACAITGGVGYSSIDQEDSKTFDFPDNIEMLDTAEQVRINALKEKAEKERRVTANQWAAEIMATRRAAMEKINFSIEECWEAYKQLNAVIEEKFDMNQAPSLNDLSKSLEAVHDQVKKILEQKRAEEPDEVEEEAAGEEGGEASGTAEGGTGTGSGAPAGAIQNRNDALKRLAAIASFFQKTEPHSPVSYLVTRAVKWGNMPLEQWLQEVVKDQTVLFQLKETLGVGGGGESSGDAGGDVYMG